MTKQTAPWGIAIVMCLVNAVAFIDRTSLPLLVQPITRDLKISDTQMSLLIGLAFIFTYSLGGLVAGVLVDRFPRRRILALGITFWGAATILCGSTFNYLVMFVGRLGVGFGEAACGPACMSIIKDAFAPQQRGRAIAMWAMGAGLGAGGALLAGGTILRLVGETGSLTLPLLGTVKAWQVVLVACGLIALPVALLVTLLPEPARSVTTGAGIESAGFRSALLNMSRRWQVFVPLFIANAATIMISTGYTSWFPAFLGRVWHVPGGEIGLRLGTIVLLLNTGGQFVAGVLIDLIRRRANPNIVPLFGVVMCAIVFVPATFIRFAPTLDVTWAMIAVLVCSAASLFTIGTATIVHLTPGHAVGRVSGIHFAWAGTVGTAIAPTVVALLSDRVFGANADSIGRALSAFAGTLSVVALLCFALVWLALRREQSASASTGSGESNEQAAALAAGIPASAVFDRHGTL
jgi:MFS family permease